MRPAELAEIHQRALRTLLAVGDVDGRGIRHLALVIADQRAGFPSGGYDTPGGSSGSRGSSSTEAAALAPDPAAQALHDLDRTMSRLRDVMRELDHLHAMWTAKPRRAMCQHCGDPTGSHAKELCWWCARWLADTHQLPPQDEIIARQSGAKRNARRPRSEAA